MENNMYGESVETFEDVIQVFALFRNCVLNLPERYNEILDSDVFIRNYEIEDKVQKHLKNPHNMQTINNFIKILKRYTDKKIREALPDGWMNDEWIKTEWMSSFNDEEEKRKEEEKIRKQIKEQIDNTASFISGILTRHKASSIKTKYIDHAFKPKIKHQRVKAFETVLVNNHLIDPHTDFLRIFRGQSPDNRINWIGSPSGFKYFIDELFKIEPFKEEKQKWIVASNTFTIEGNPVPLNIRTHKAKDVINDTKKLINTAISYLTD